MQVYVAYQTKLYNDFDIKLNYLKIEYHALK